MIRVVGANPALDRISTWPRIALGGVNRATEVLVVAGGKGLNVARAVRALGSEVAIHGFLGGSIGDQIRDLARVDGITDRHTPIRAQSRVCSILVEPGSRRSTVLNEPGPQVTADEVSSFLHGLREACTAGDLVLVSGSLPDSLDPDLAGEIVDIGRAAGARTIVDMSGASLEAALRARPWMLKLNRGELEALGGREGTRLDGRAAMQRGGQASMSTLATDLLRIRDRGVSAVVVTMGADGLLATGSTGILHAAVPRVDVVNATGSGDLVLAGLAVALERGASWSEAIALGAACGTAGATWLAPSLPPGFDANAWASLVRVDASEAPGATEAVS